MVPRVATGRLAALLAAAALLTVACAAEPEDIARRHGLLVLTADTDGAAALQTWVATDDGAAARDVGLPGPATTWVAAGRASVLVATLADGSLHVSDPVVPDDPALGDLAWRPVEAVDLTGDPAPGPAWFPTWDPEGGRFAALTGDLAGGGTISMTLVDPTTSTSFTMPLPAQPLAAAPAWVDADRLAFTGGSSSEPAAVLVDTTTGSSSEGPPGDRRVASSADGSVVATTAGPGSPVTVRATDAWLAHDGTSIGAVEPPADGATAASIALDGTGTRLAVAWLLAGGSIRIDVHDGNAGWGRVSSETHDDGAIGAVVGWLR